MYVQPKVIIHGGAGSCLNGKGGLDAVRKDLRDIVEAIHAKLSAGADSKTAVIFGCQLLEDNPRFNAGRGSVLQSDGQVRMSASLMDGITQRFSGVINVSRVQHPIGLAEFLQECDDRVLSDYGSLELARELCLPVFDPVTDLRLQEWMQERADNFQRSMAGVVAEPELVDSSARRGTIGVVALDFDGRIAAGTSTGGKGLERIGRVSDSAMPAGNYANTSAGISCTGIGEDIIDECLAPKIVIRVTDGMTLAQAFDKSFAEAASRSRDFGAIGLDWTGTIAWGKTSDILLGAYHTGETVGDTLELDLGTITGTC
ncbi:MAG TPA: isoaspartyl peptidase/L-asparaginase [Trichocoleus sp.]